MSLRQDFVVAGTGRHSGGFLLRIMPPSWHPVPACTPRLRCRRAILNCSSDDAAAIRKSRLEIKNRCSLWAVLEGFLALIPKSGLEIKNHCTQKAVSGKKHAVIPKFGPEIKNHCTLYGVSGQKLAAIPKSGPEIKNRCSSKPVLEAGHSSSRQRRIESDAVDRCRNGRSRRAILLCSYEN